MTLLPSLRWLTATLASVSLTFSAFAQVPDWLDDPLFFPSAPGTSTGYAGQWHLINLYDPSGTSIDANLAGAWSQGWTGAGVIIGIVDQGTEANHPDLIAQYHNVYSWDFERGTEQTSDPWRALPHYDWERHGTAVAGVAAARGGNGIGVTGAAPLAGLAGIRLLYDNDIDADWLAEHEVYAILYQGGADALVDDPRWDDPDWVPPVRVKNHSYGSPSGYHDYGNLDDVAAALKLSAERGVIHLFSASNARLRPAAPSSALSTADANKIYRLNQPNALVVGALGNDGTYANYSSYGANLFVTAPSGSRIGTPSIATTDVTGHDRGYNDGNDGPNAGLEDEPDYTNTFSGTSSSTPLMSGIMALGMEANPDLNVRMAKHLLVRTSRQVDAGHTVADSPNGWIINAAGNAFSADYGFGLVDAGAFTKMATQVAALTPLIEHQSAVQEVDLAFGEGASRSLTKSYTVHSDDLTNGALPLEYVRVTLTLSGLQADADAYRTGGIGAIAGDLEGWLTSPSGTRYRLFSDDQFLPTEKRDFFSETLTWTYLSNAYWGETILGQWVLELENHSVNPLDVDGGYWESFQMEFGMGELYLVPEPSALFWLGGAVMAGAVWRRRTRRMRTSAGV